MRAAQVWLRTFIIGEERHNLFKQSDVVAKQKNSVTRLFTLHFIKSAHKTCTLSHYMVLFCSLFFIDMEDACMWEFTPGQIKKMERDVKQFKPTLIKNVYSE